MNTWRKILILLSASMAFYPALSKAANEASTAAPENIVVYINKGNTQCNDDGLSPADSAKALAAAGIDVIETSCGTMTGVGFAAVCGGGTGDIIAHEIDKKYGADAAALGYRPIQSLVDEKAMTGYEIGACPGK